MESKKKRKVVKSVFIGGLASLLLGNGIAVFNNPYVYDELYLKATKGYVITPRISNWKESFDENLITYIQNFPEYKEDFINKYSKIKIHAHRIDRYTLSNIQASYFRQDKNQIILRPDKISRDFPHELGHFLSYDKTNDICGFKKRNGFGMSINEGFQTLLFSELFLEEPVKVEDSTLYNADLVMARIFTHIFGKDVMKAIFFEEGKSVDNLIPYIEKYLDSEEESKNYISLSDKSLNFFFDYCIQYNKYKNEGTVAKEEIIKSSKVVQDNYKELFSMTFKLVNNYIKESLNNEETLILDLFQEIQWFSDQFCSMNNYIKADLDSIENYNEFEELCEKVNLSVDEIYGKNYVIDRYRYKSFYIPEKTSYLSTRKEFDLHNNEESPVKLSLKP